VPGQIVNAIYINRETIALKLLPSVILRRSRATGRHGVRPVRVTFPLNGPIALNANILVFKAGPSREVNSYVPEMIGASVLV